MWKGWAAACPAAEVILGLWRLRQLKLSAAPLLGMRQRPSRRMGSTGARSSRSLVICAADGCVAISSVNIGISWQPCWACPRDHALAGGSVSLRCSSPHGQARRQPGMGEAGSLSRVWGQVPLRPQLSPAARTSHALSTCDTGWANLGLTRGLTDSWTDSQKSALSTSASIFKAMLGFKWILLSKGMWDSGVPGKLPVA